ncbi:MAG TPA: ABC transporter substrate-binding protein, partial [Verrucomicrobiae bacterium]|nr:ABC transporter substrate-binding protein [Verrucomicrobiae bacterium]
NDQKITVVAMIHTSSLSNAVLARRDRGISSVGDLKGKRVAATQGTTSDFFLDMLLLTNGVPESAVQTVDLPAGKAAEALETGEVDAASVFSPFSLSAAKTLGQNGVTFRDEDIYRQTFTLVASRDFVRTGSGKVRKVLRALLQAEDFLRRYPAEAQKIVAEKCGLEPALLRELWNDAGFAVGLDQTLVLALEEEAVWGIRHRLSPRTQVPNFLEYIDVQDLTAVRPSAVEILR